MRRVREERYENPISLVLRFRDETRRRVELVYRYDYNYSSKAVPRSPPFINYLKGSTPCLYRFIIRRRTWLGPYRLGMLRLWVSSANTNAHRSVLDCNWWRARDKNLFVLLYTVALRLHRFWSTTKYVPSNCVRKLVFFEFSSRPRLGRLSLFPNKFELSEKLKRQFWINTHYKSERPLNARGACSRRLHRSRNINRTTLLYR